MGALQEHESTDSLAASTSFSVTSAISALSIRCLLKPRSSIRSFRIRCQYVISQLPWRRCGQQLLSLIALHVQQRCMNRACSAEQGREQQDAANPLDPADIVRTPKQQPKPPSPSCRP